MTPLLHPTMINGRTGDPGVYVSFKFEKRAILFDLGDLTPLSARQLLRLTDIFVSHTHMDHFIGFDRVLRTLFGRDATVRLWGPAGFLDHVGHRLAGYSWNLVDRYDAELVFSATEVISPERARIARFRSGTAFRREDERDIEMDAGLLLDDGAFQVRCAILDHRIPCLAFALEERSHVNIWKSRLDDRGLPVGPWLRELKQAVLTGKPDDTPIRVGDHKATNEEVRTLPLGELRRQVLKIVPGQKIAYVVDVVHSEDNARRIIELAHHADIFFVEAVFARSDADRAADRYHLTTDQAGSLARAAGVQRVEPFHFSPRYSGNEELLMQEVYAAFHGQPECRMP